MKLLILGGTAWLGHRTALAAAAEGHRVTCAARGISGPAPSGTRFLQVDRDAEDGLAAAAAEDWDAVIDVSRQPGQVRRAVRDLSASTDFYVFVSTGNVYASQKEFGQDEDSPLLPPLDREVMESMDSYGPAKVACERTVTEAFDVGSRAIVRAGLIGGPGDTSGRSGYWPLRFAYPSDDGGRVLVPAAGSQPTQLIDVRDLAEWLICVARERTPGVFNATGHTVPFAGHLETAARVAAAYRASPGDDAAVSAAPPMGPVHLVEAPGEWLAEQSVNEWSGPRSLPLWLSDPDWHGMNARSNQRALAAGLNLRSLADTLADTLEWEAEQCGNSGSGGSRRAGLEPQEERELLALLDAERRDAGGTAAAGKDPQGRR